MLNHRALSRPAISSCFPRRSRAASLRVIAYRDAHRQQQLKQTAHEFATCYAKAIVEGSSAAPMFEEADPCIEVKDAHPLGATIYKGTDSVTMKLQQDHTTRYGLRTAEGKPSTQPQIILQAASDTSDTAFCLIELPPALSSISAAAVEDFEARPSYMLLKMDILYDDTVCRVQRVEERTQLVSEMDEARRGVREILKRRQQEMPSMIGAAFPKSRLQPWAGALRAQTGAGGFLPPEVHEGTAEGLEAHAMGAVRNFCALHDSRHHTDRTELEHIMDMDSYQLYDAYGVLPLLCDPGLQSQQEATPSSARPPIGGASGLSGSLDAKRMLDVLEMTKSVYNVECRLIDAAICEEYAAGFASWTSRMKNKMTGKLWCVMGTDVSLFEPDTGRLVGNYVFRDALDFEERLLHAASATEEPKP